MPRDAGHFSVHRFQRLKRLNIRCAGALVPLLDVETNPLSLVEGLEARSLNGAVMYENIPTFIIFNEAKTLLLIKPLHFAFCHC